MTVDDFSVESGRSASAKHAVFRECSHDEVEKKKKKKTQKSKPAEIHIPAETSRNSPKRPKHIEILPELEWGCLVPVKLSNIPHNHHKANIGKSVLKFKSRKAKTSN
jgi:hypothetical protein